MEEEAVEKWSHAFIATFTRSSLRFNAWIGFEEGELRNEDERLDHLKC